MSNWDGAQLFYRSWIPPQPTAKAVLLFHRGHEHSGRWAEFVEMFGLNDIAIFAWDARGHGRSTGERGAAENFGTMVKDVDAFVRHIGEHHGFALENMIVLAHSVGAVSVAAWVHDYAPPIRAMILATPAFRVRLYVPLAIPSLRLKLKFVGPGYVKSYVKSKMLTHDREQAARYDCDPLIFRQIAVNVLLDLHDTAKRLVADAGAIRTPTLMIGAGKDWVVSLKAQREFFDRLSSQEKRFEVFPGAYHAIFHETNRREVVEVVHDFIRAQFANAAIRRSLVNADQNGYTHDEFMRLQRNGSLGFAIARAGLKIASRFSKGIEIGSQTGFDSGISLDYVYENLPQGLSPVGRLIDAAYLNAIGWRGIRQRKANLKAALQRMIKRAAATGRNVHIIDIAAGTGRYVIETMQELPNVSISALLRDNCLANADIIRKDAKEFGLKLVSAEVADAFDREAVARIQPRATIGIVSGLYELFPSNALVLNSLRGLAEAIEPGGYLIYTNQPWHPQLEFIAHVLRNREGERWIMRRRTTAEMDELVQTAGFEKIEMEIDQWGMFTVSIARRGR